MPKLLAALLGLALGPLSTFAAAREDVYHDDFEANAKATNQFPVPAFAGHQFLELSRVNGRPMLTTAFDAAGVSADGDEIRIELAVRVDGGVFSLYGKQGDSPNGQIGFWGDNRVGVVDPTQNAWQFVNAQLNPNAWNSVIVKYVNGTGTWGISVNGSAFESFPSYGNGTLSGIRLQTDSGGTVSYSDTFVVRNATKNAVLFSDDFEEGLPDTAPNADGPQIGSWTAIDASQNLLLRNDLPVVGFGALAQPLLGTNVVVGSPAKASDLTPPGPHGGTTYLRIDRDASRQDRFRGAFTKAASAATHDSVHAEAWIRAESGMVQWGLNASDTVVSLWPEADGRRITVYDGTSHIDTGLVYSTGTWAKYEIDYVVGSTQITLTANGVSTVATVPPITQVSSVWIEAGDVGTLAGADDVLASIQAGSATPSNVLFKDGFERGTVGQVPGLSDPEVGVYAVVGSSSAVQVLSGSSFNGPPSAHSGQNYLIVDRANSGQRPVLSALFGSGAFAAKSKILHIEFYRWQPATAGNYGNIAVGNSSTDFGPTAQLLYGISWPDDLSLRGYNGSSYVPSGLTFTPDHWDKVALDWDGVRLVGQINDGTPAEISLFGTPDTLIDRLYFETSGGGTLFYLDDLSVTVVPPPATKLLSTIPKDGATGVAVDTAIELKLADGAQQVQAGSIRLSINGNPVTPAISQTTQEGVTVTTASYVPASPFPYGSINTVRWIYNDNALPPNISTNNLTFTVAAGATLFADNFENSQRATNTVSFLPYQGTAFMEINRDANYHPHFYASGSPSVASDAGDEIIMQFAIRVLTGEVSVYPRAQTDSTSSSFDTGQLGFFANGDVGIVDPTGSFFQWLNAKTSNDAWNLITVKYVNGSGDWAISVNGGAFESRSGKGSDGGDFGLNMSGFKLKCDAAGISYLDAISVTNKTKGAALFVANFDNATVGEPPAPTDPQVGTWSALLAPAGLTTRDAVARQVVTDAPPNAPQVGSYGASSALVESTIPHSGSKSVYLYPALGHGEVHALFTTPVPAGIAVHAEAWIYHVGDRVHWGLTTPNDPQFVNVTLQPVLSGRGITTFDGTADVETGLVYTDNTWEKYQIDYLVGSDKVVITLNDLSVTNTVPARTQVTGLWFISGLPNDDFQARGFVDDVFALAPLPLNPAQPTLHYARTAQQLTLSWEGSGFSLQENETIHNAAGWQTIGSTSPVTLTFGNGSRFYRLKK